MDILVPNLGTLWGSFKKQQNKGWDRNSLQSRHGVFHHGFEQAHLPWPCGKVRKKQQDDGPLSSEKWGFPSP